MVWRTTIQASSRTDGVTKTRKRTRKLPEYLVVFLSSKYLLTSALSNQVDDHDKCSYFVGKTPGITNIVLVVLPLMPHSNGIFDKG